MVLERLRSSRAAWLVAGVVLGLVLGGYWPDTPSYAVATDRHGDYAIATGYVDEDVEAVYFLDFLTGNLQAAVLSPVNGQFFARYERNVMADLELATEKQPRYIMVTGYANQRKRAQSRLSQNVLYVADATTGKIAAYAIPFQGGQRSANAAVAGQLEMLSVTQFRTAQVRE